MPEPPLTDRELRIVRGMLDEHEYDMRRGAARRHFWTAGRVWFAFVLGLVLVVLQIVVAALALTHT